MPNYVDQLRKKYRETIIRVVYGKPRITLGDLIDTTYKEINSSDKSKSEIRDAILFLAGENELYIEAISRKRLEITSGKT